MAAYAEKYRRDVFVALQIRIGAMFQQITRYFGMEGQQRSHAMLVHTVWICTAFDQSLDRFEITCDGSLYKFIVSHHYVLPGSRNGVLEAYRATGEHSSWEDCGLPRDIPSIIRLVIRASMSPVISQPLSERSSR